MVSCLDKALGGSLPALSAHSFANNGQLALFESAEEGKSFPLNARIDRGSAGATDGSLWQSSIQSSMLLTISATAIARHNV